MRDKSGRGSCFLRGWGRSVLLAAVLAGTAGPASALTFRLSDLGIAGTLNTTATVGAEMRMQDRSSDLLGVSSLDRDRCGGIYQSCQGLFREQTFPAERLASSRGQLSSNFDDGNWNYDKGDLTQAVFRLNQDLQVTRGNFGIFARWIYFYDFVNNHNFTERHPNRITSDNINDPNVGATGLAPVGGQLNQGNSNLLFARTFGRGEPVEQQRTDGRALSQIGTDFQLLDLNFFGTVPFVGDRNLTFKIGRQSLNWGESTYFLVNSINTINPLNANNFFRVGDFLDLEEVFTPVGMAYFATDLFTNASVEVFYQYEWRPTEIPTPGSFYSFADLGTNNVRDFVHVHFGGSAEDPEGIASPLNNPLSGVTNTSLRVPRLPDNEPRGGGQYGASFKYFFEDFNNGTELGLYYIRYHSRFPYVSTYATEASCARREGSAIGIDATDPVTFLLSCPDLPLTRPLGLGDPNAATSNAVPFDTMRVQLEYPEDIDMFGVSFNTTLGGWSVQGEVAYRPKLPMQVDQEDLVFAAFGPTLSRCHDPAIGCIGSGLGVTGPAGELVGGLLDLVGLDPTAIQNALQFGGLGYYPDGSQGIYAPSDYVIDANGTRGQYNDTFDLVIGHAPGSARSFPSFVIPYRGVAAGENEPCAAGLQNRDYNSSLPCYIRGWENFRHFQFNLGGTYLLGASENPIGADQIIFVIEAAASYIDNLPPLDQLQIESLGTYTHASAGADGTGADRSRQACSTDPATGQVREGCSFGGDGLRFNPTQADLNGYVTSFAWAYTAIALIRYESVFPGISFAPFIAFNHSVKGTAPGLDAQLFMKEGHKNIFVQLETRYRSNLSVNLGYRWFTGGGERNLLRDRDSAFAFVRFRF
jgi:hypothetical protein